MRTGHLFAGIDGIGLGLEPHGFVPAWFSEYESAPSRVLEHHYPDVPNHGDITAIDWSKVEPVDVLTGGFPCQDLSYAGKGAGIKEGTRSGLWFEYVRAIRALRPRIVLIENVSALLTRGLDIVLCDLHESGFDAEWTTLRASDVGAAHRRERLFIVAVAAQSHDGGWDGWRSGEPATSGAGRQGRFRRAAGASEDAADSYDAGLEGRRRSGFVGSVERSAGQGGVQVVADGDDFGQQRGRRSWGRGHGPTNDGVSAADFDGGGRQERSEQDGGKFGPGLEASRRSDARRCREAPSYTTVGRGSDEQVGTDEGRPLVGPVTCSSGGASERPATEGIRELGRGPGVAWGEFKPAIRRWEYVTGRPAPAPTVDGRLSADFTEWHMGFPEGWTSMLSRNERLKALGNAVVPQCAEVVGRWALELVGREVAA